MKLENLLGDIVEKCLCVCARCTNEEEDKCQILNKLLSNFKEIPTLFYYVIMFFLFRCRLIYVY